ncbi:hypothetical protein CBL_00645 [Carabus blaptoides fortunei]
MNDNEVKYCRDQAFIRSTGLRGNVSTVCCKDMMNIRNGPRDMPMGWPISWNGPNDVAYGVVELGPKIVSTPKQCRVLRNLTLFYSETQDDTPQINSGCFVKQYKEKGSIPCEKRTNSTLIPLVLAAGPLEFLIELKCNSSSSRRIYTRRRSVVNWDDGERDGATHGSVSRFPKSANLAADENSFILFKYVHSRCEPDRCSLLNEKKETNERANTGTARLAIAQSEPPVIYAS